MNYEYQVLIDYLQLEAVSTTASPLDAKAKACTGHHVANEFIKAHLCLQLRYINRSPEYFLYTKLSQLPTLMSQTTSTYFPQTSRNSTHPTPGTQPS